MTIDDVMPATTSSDFTHYASKLTNEDNTWTLTRKTYDVTANLAGDAYWNTFYSTAGNYQAPEGTQVFAVDLTGTAITMTEISDRIVKSGEGVVLKNTTTGSNTLTLTETEPTGDFSSNSLTGTMTSITNPGNSYVLNNGSNAWDQEW